MREKINSGAFAERMGSYSHGYKVDVGSGFLIFTSGQIALDRDGNVVYPDDVGRQAEFVFGCLRDILRKAGASLDDVVKATIYVTDMADYAVVSQVRNRCFSRCEPATTLVEVSALAREGCRVEVEVVAACPKPVA